MYAESIKDRATALQSCIADAVDAFEVRDESQLALTCGEQNFPNSGCGFSGDHIVMRAFTRASVVVISKFGDKPVRVYINGKFAYSVDCPNLFLREAMRDWTLFAQDRYEDQYEALKNCLD